MPWWTLSALLVRHFFFQTFGLVTRKPTSVANTTVSSKEGSLRKCLGGPFWLYRFDCSFFRPSALLLRSRHRWRTQQFLQNRARFGSALGGIVGPIGWAALLSAPLPYYREDDIRLEQNRILPEGSWLGRCLVELFARISSKTFSKGPCIKTLKQTSVSSRPVASKAGSVSQVPRGHFLPHRFECIF